MRNTIVGDFNVCKNAANQFFHVAKWCSDNRDPINFIMNTFYPYAVNVAFACELYLKAIMIYRSSQNEFSKGHNLKELFDNLPFFDANQLSQIFAQKYSSKTLEMFLDENKNTFIDWRYALEHEVKAEISAFDVFVSILKEYVEKIS
ncbi:MAG: hypothetical protein IJK02_02630 [Clostridia bacterium]|nr:hypothetical protein [Clostridia bacterium]